MKILRNLAVLSILALGVSQARGQGPAPVGPKCGDCTCSSGQTCSTFGCGFLYVKTCCACTNAS